MANIGDTGINEQVSDLVLFLHLSDNKKPGSATDLIIAKQRDKEQIMLNKKMEKNMNAMEIVAEDILNVYDDFINSIWDNILYHIKNEKIVINNLNDEFKNIKLSQNSWGVYVFHIKPKIEITEYEDLLQIWQKDHNDRLIKYIPQAYKGMFKPLKKDKLHYFYVGKSQDLLQCIREHINLNISNSTYALKLSEHKKLLEVAVFEYSYFILTDKNPKEELKDSMNFLLEIIEKKLRKELKPIIGKQ